MYVSPPCRGCIGEKESVAPKLDTCVHRYERGPRTFPHCLCRGGEDTWDMMTYIPTYAEESQSFGTDWASANCGHDPECLLRAREHEPDSNFHPGKGHGLQRAQFSDDVVWSVKRAPWRELLMFITLDQTLIGFVPALYLFWSIADTVCACLCLYTCMCVCVCVCMCVCA